LAIHVITAEKETFSDIKIKDTVGHGIVCHHPPDCARLQMRCSRCREKENAHFKEKCGKK
jgi:predicted RNA-binding Zn-ribbon protein involved in translation (DUF1610 family)